MKINNNFVLKGLGASNTQNEFQTGRHSWYYYKEGFSPQLVNHAIEQVGIDKKDLIIDPFNGSGTVTLSASKLNFKSIGIEVNPFSAFLATTKLAEIQNDRKLIKNVADTQAAIYKCSELSPLLNFSTFSKTSGKEKWLFNKSVINAFYSGLKQSKKFEDKSIRDVIRLGLIAAAMDNCNAIRDGKCLRYRNGWQTLKFNKDSFYQTFNERMKIISNDLLNEPINTGKSVIVNDDSRKFLHTNKQKFKLCITSPPYLNSFDYTDVYRPELFLGNFIKTQNGLLELRKRTVRSHVNVNQSELLNTDFGMLYKETLAKIKTLNRSPWQKKIPIMIQAYFEDMNSVMRDLRKNAKPDAELWLTVSNSAYTDIAIPVDLILANIGSIAGWFLSEIGVLRYISKRGTKYSPDISHLRESVVIFKANK